MVNAIRILKYTVPAVLLLAQPVLAQSAGELNIRMSQMEDQMRQLMGQVEQLSFELRETRKELARIGGVPAPTAAKRKVGAIEQRPLSADTIESAPLQTPPRKKVTAAEPGIEQIEDPAPNNDGGGQVVVAGDNAPGPQILGQLPGSNSAAKPNDGGFQGVIVDPGTDATVRSETDVETVALGTPSTDTAESLYEHSYESLLRRQFGDAEGGFRSFLGRYREHSLAGNAQYWLGETYYVQGDYRQAAQSFLSGYQEFPKSRKAPDSLLKLGLSLNRLGQTQQACAALLAVSDKFPKAAEAKKRAAKEAQRAGC
jgi:tol-pal system protein YbgF